MDYQLLYHALQVCKRKGDSVRPFICLVIFAGVFTLTDCSGTISRTFHLPQSFKVSRACCDNVEHLSSINCAMLTRCRSRKAANVSFNWFLPSGWHNRDSTSPSLNSCVALSFAAILSALFVADDRSTFSRETKMCLTSSSSNLDNSFSNVFPYSENMNSKNMWLHNIVCSRLVHGIISSASNQPWVITITFDLGSFNFPKYLIHYNNLF